RVAHFAVPAASARTARRAVARHRMAIAELLEAREPRLPRARAAGAAPAHAPAVVGGRDRGRRLRSARRRRAAQHRGGLVRAAARGPAFSLRSYPVRELDWMERNRYLAGRVATQDFVGNLRTLRDGPGRNVFFDDRFDMYPRAVGKASFDLLAGSPDYQAILDRYRVDTVLWEKKLPLAVVLQADRRWRVVHTTKSWVVITRAV